MSTSSGMDEPAGAARWPADARFTELIARRRENLLRLAVLLTGSRKEGEDAVQEAVLAVSRSWMRVLAQAGEAVAYSYLRTAVIRKSVDLQRSRIPLGAAAEVAIENDGLLRFEQDRQFFALVAALPQQQRAVLVLRYYADFDDRRIAAVLGVRGATVRSNATRGLEKLREREVMEEKR
jgi:RNA polymerase sigma factor (sigma-70 family)